MLRAYLKKYPKAISRTWQKLAWGQLEDKRGEE
jgi:hypothetical protein